MCVLPVNVDEQAAERFQVLQVDGLPIDERSRAAVGADEPAQRAGGAIVEPALG